MIEVKNLVKKYGNRIALDNISFSANDGEVLGFLGPNGAGKSTTMNILTGYLSSTSGSVKVSGFDILGEPLKAKEKIGYLPEIPPLYPDMTVNSYLKFIFELKKVKIALKEEHIKDIVRKVKIEKVENRLIKNLSKGYKQRVGLAGALLGNPQILILDEPTVGLDPKQIIEIRELIKELKKYHTIILSSHILPEIQSICDRILVINQGKIVADDTAKNLSEKFKNGKILKMIIEGDENSVVNLLKNIPGVKLVITVKQIEENVFRYNLEVENEKETKRSLFFALSANKMPILELRDSAFSLEEIFLKLTEEKSK